MIRWLALGAIFLAGCAGSRPVAECAPNQIEALIQAALEAGQGPPYADQADCRVADSMLREGWIQAACSPEGGWRIGLAGQPLPDGCDGADRWLLEGHRLGQEYRRLIQGLAAFDEETVSTLEQVRLTRERDLIRGIAQLKGWPLPDPENTP